MAITIVITKDGLIRLIEECYKHEDPLEKLDCLEKLAKLLLKAIENTRKNIKNKNQN